MICSVFSPSLLSLLDNLLQDDHRTFLFLFLSRPLGAGTKTNQFCNEQKRNPTKSARWDVFVLCTPVTIVARINFHIRIFVDSSIVSSNRTPACHLHSLESIWYRIEFELSTMRFSTTMCYYWWWCIMVLCAPHPLMGAASDSNLEETNAGVLGTDVMRGLDTRKRSRRRRMSERARAQSDAWIQEDSSLLRHPPPRCDCLLEQGCKEPKRIRRRSDKEVFGFVDPDSTGAGFNWTHITTVAWATTDELRCAAHEAGARVLLAAPTFDLNQASSSISSWVNQVVRMVDNQNADGIVFDYEDPLSSEDPRASTYVTLIHATRVVLKKKCLLSRVYRGRRLELTVDIIPTKPWRTHRTYFM
jgi:hypothetical protein